MKQAICVKCKKFVKYAIRKTDDAFTVKGELVKYKKKIAYCRECGEEVWVAEVDDYNANAPFKKYCKIHKLKMIGEKQE